MPLDPQAQEVADELDRMGGDAPERMSPHEARRLPTLADAARRLREARGLDPEGEPVAQIADVDADGVPVRLYRPSSDGVLPLLVWAHGGGWVLGELGASEATCRALANRARCLVASVGYRRAPEHRLPAAHDDAQTATAWLLHHATALGADPSRYALGGESAGANLAIATAAALAAAGRPRPRLLLLLCPVTDLSGKAGPSPGDGSLGGPTLEWMLEHVVDDPGDARDPRVSPLLAERERLLLLAPALLLTASLDPLREQGEALCRRLEAEGLATRTVCLPGVMHGYGELVGLVDAVDGAFDAAGEALREAFSPPRASEAPTGAPAG